MSKLEAQAMRLQIEDICMAYDGETALAHISFNVMAGEFLSILGPSGCGKTTLLRILIGLLKPDSGRVFKDGRDITNLPPAARGIGIVFQNLALFENMTVLGNVEYALRIHSKTRAAKNEARQSALEMIRQLGLSEYAYKKPAELSGGQQQRVAIARTLVMTPDVILFDEPMSALDAATRLTLREELKQLQKKFSTTMIYITHDQEEAFAMSDRILVMNKARVAQLGTPKEIITAPADDYVRDFVLHNLKLKLNSFAKYAGDIDARMGRV